MTVKFIFCNFNFTKRENFLTHFFFFFFNLNFYSYFHQKITTQILQSKTYKNVLYNKHKIKNLKVKIKANKNDNKNNKIKN